MFYTTAEISFTHRFSDIGIVVKIVFIVKVGIGGTPFKLTIFAEVFPSITKTPFTYCGGDVGILGKIISGVKF